jgi:hypothetical protein
MQRGCFILGETPAGFSLASGPSEQGGVVLTVTLKEVLKRCHPRERKEIHVDDV